MIVIKAKEMARLESLAYQDGIDPNTYMLNAGQGIFEVLLNLIKEKKLPSKVILIAGKGNNAGDGYVALKLLKEKGIDVKVFALFEKESFSTLCKKHFENYIKANGEVVFIKDPKEIKLDKDSFILDGILGTGFKGELTSFLSKCIQEINSQAEEKNLKVVSIDIPSGINGDTGEANVCIKSFLTIYLGFAKFGFFINSAPNYIENLKGVDFKLEKKYKNQAKIKLTYMEDIDYKKYLPKIDKKRHKYDAGFVLGIAGSQGMFGAAKLSSLAALRSGCGIVKVITEKEIPNSFFELVNYVLNYTDIEQILQLCMSADSIFIGPGIGRDQKIEDFLFKILPKITKKTVLDADALFHYANNLNMILPKDSVLTPHKNEMKKLLDLDEKISDEDLLEKTKKFSQDKNVIIVLKGYPTFIFHPKKEPLTILGGDPGLATAGSGDVLTGMIASFASQKLDLYEASILAVNLHFKAAQFAAKEKTSYSLIASDVIEFLPQAFKSVLS